MPRKLSDTMTWPEICLHAVNRLANKTGSEKQKFIDWMLTKEQLGYQFDALTHARCHFINTELNKKYDHFTVITGVEGSGKSTLAAQYCATISPTFSLNHLCFELLKLLKEIKGYNVGDSILLDEGALFLFSRDSMTGDNRIVTKLFTIFRQLSLNVVICIPNFWMLDSYVREHRVMTLIHIIERGKFIAYTGDAIRLLAIKGKRNKSFYGVRIPDGTSWRGYNIRKFPEINNLSYDTYMDHKRQVLDNFVDQITQQVESRNVKPGLIKIKEAAIRLNMSHKKLKGLIKEKVINGSKIGGNYYIPLNTVTGLENGNFG